MERVIPRQTEYIYLVEQTGYVDRTGDQVLSPIMPALSRARWLTLPKYPMKAGICIQATHHILPRCTVAGLCKRSSLALALAMARIS